MPRVLILASSKSAVCGLADAMSEAAAAVDAESDLNLGTSRFIDYHPLKPLREWDGRHFGTYDPTD